MKKKCRPRITHTTCLKPPRNLMRSIETTLYTGIDYKFRPGSYWTASANPLEAVLRNMKGQRRKETVRDLYAAGKLEGPFDILLRDSLADEARKWPCPTRPNLT